MLLHLHAKQRFQVLFFPKTKKARFGPLLTQILQIKVFSKIPYQSFYTTVISRKKSEHFNYFFTIPEKPNFWAHLRSRLALKPQNKVFY